MQQLNQTLLHFSFEFPSVWQARQQFRSPAASTPTIRAQQVFADRLDPSRPKPLEHIPSDRWPLPVAHGQQLCHGFRHWGSDLPELPLDHIVATELRKAPPGERTRLPCGEQFHHQVLHQEPGQTRIIQSHLPPPGPVGSLVTPGKHEFPVRHRKLVQIRALDHFDRILLVCSRATAHPGEADKENQGPLPFALILIHRFGSSSGKPRLERGAALSASSQASMVSWAIRSSNHSSDGTSGAPSRKVRP